MPSSDGAAPAPAPAPAAPVALRVLFWVCVVLITHGSLYPWEFQAPPSVAIAFAELMAQRKVLGFFGDMVGNVALFVPLGVLWVAARPVGRPLRAHEPLPLLIGGIVFAWLLQVLQLWTPARDPALGDVFWNTVGLLLGLGAALALRAPLRALTAGANAPQRLTLALLALWLALEWFPFVPTIDWQHVKDALKPLLLQPAWRSASAIDAALGVLVVAHLMRPWPRRGLLLPALVALATTGKLFIADQTISLPHASGFVAGLLLAPLLWRVAAHRADTLVVVMALGWFTLDELRPFELAEAVGTVHWIPFTALLQGSLSANVVAFGRMIFWLGTAIVLAGAGGARSRGLAVGLSVWALLLEVSQALLPGRVADPTVALIPWFWVLVRSALESAAPSHKVRMAKPRRTA